MHINPAVLEQQLSPERLAPYRAVAGSLAAAVALYEWNARISGALWETFGHVEVLIRNAMHARLTAWSASVYHKPTWYLDHGGHLTWRAVKDVTEARGRATQNGAAETPGRVVAELGFGFWRYLTAGHYDRTLWRYCVFQAFPGQARRRVQDALKDLHLARNRCAHHEPMHNRPVGQLHDTALEVAGWVDPSARQWVSARSRVPRNLRDRP